MPPVLPEVLLPESPGGRGLWGCPTEEQGAWVPLEIRVGVPLVLGLGWGAAGSWGLCGTLGDTCVPWGGAVGWAPRHQGPSQAQVPSECPWCSFSLPPPPTPPYQLCSYQPGEGRMLGPTCRLVNG